MTTLRVEVHTMKPLARFATLITMVLAFVTVSSGAHAQTFLTNDEIMQAFVGKTLSGNSFKTDEPWTAKVLPHKRGKPKGKLEGIYKGDAYTSKWRIKKDQWCEDWGGKSGFVCWQLERVSQQEVRPWSDGKPTKRIWTISE